MRSRALRVTIAVLAFLIIGSAAAFVIRSERQLGRHRQLAVTFAPRAHQIGDALADIRTYQQAYLAVGQDPELWMTKVSERSAAAFEMAAALRGAAVTPAATAALDEVVSALNDLADSDKRAREYIRTGAPLMAADVILSDATETSRSAGRQLERAADAEIAGTQENEATIRKMEAAVLGGAAGLVLLAVLLLTPRARLEVLQSVTPEPAESETTADYELQRLPVAGAPPIEVPAPVVESTQAPATEVLPLARIAELCTDLGRVMDSGGLSSVLERAASLLEASGLMVWLGTPAGTELKAVLAHGYSADLVARMPAIPRSAHNAAAAAFRTGAPQTVSARDVSERSALVVPLLAPEGCIGAFTIELSSADEPRESTRAVASILAAQLSGLLGMSVVGASHERAAGAAG
jgi:hypothetical protein